MEIWKDIPGYEGLYQITLSGKVRSLNYRRTGKIKELKFGLNTGYLCVILYKQGKRKLFRFHILVAMTFMGHIPDGHNSIVDHKNNNCQDNNLENLQIITHRKNSSKDIKRNLPTGVSIVRNKYKARIQIKGKNKHLGCFSTPEEASQAYQNELKLIKNHD